MKNAFGISRRWSGWLVACGLLLSVSLSAGFSEEPKADKAKEKKKEAKADQGWKSLFDGKTLDGWKDSGFGGGGETTVEQGNLQIGYGEGCNGVTFTKEFPKVDYEVRLQAQRVDGTDFFCGMTFPVQDSPCSFIVGGWSGSVVGLSSIDGDDANHNDTRKLMAFKNKQWYDIRLRVTKTRISAWIDDKLIVDQETTGHKLSVRPEVEKSRPFGLCSYSTTAALRKIEVRKLTEEEAQPGPPS
jgi:hypothetical protein